MERIWTRGSGLLDTHVSWKDVQESLEEHFKQKIEFGENKSIQDVTGGTENACMSRVGLVYPHWKTNDKKLPEKFVIKVFTILNSVSKRLSLGQEKEVHEEFEPKEEAYFGYYHSEVLICQNMQKYLTEEDKFAVPHIYCIRPLSAENRGRGFILMEFIENDGCPEVANNHIREMLQVIVDMQLIGRRFSKEERTELHSDPTASKWEYGSELGSDPIGVLRLVSDDTDYQRKIDQIEPYIVEVKDEKLQDYLDQATEHIGIDRVFVHGDLHGGNVLWKKEGEEYELKAVIDYQFSHFGSPAWDLVYFVLSIEISNENLRNWRQYTKNFYELHCEKEKPSYSFEKLESCFVHIWPMWCLDKAVWNAVGLTEMKRTELESCFVHIWPMWCLLKAVWNADGVTEKKGTEEYNAAYERLNTLLDHFLGFHPQNQKNYEQNKQIE